MAEQSGAHKRHGAGESYEDWLSKLGVEDFVEDECVHTSSATSQNTHTTAIHVLLWIQGRTKTSIKMRLVNLHVVRLFLLPLARLVHPVDKIHIQGRFLAEQGLLVVDVDLGAVSAMISKDLALRNFNRR